MFSGVDIFGSYFASGSGTDLSSGGGEGMSNQITPFSFLPTQNRAQLRSQLRTPEVYARLRVYKDQVHSPPSVYN